MKKTLLFLLLSVITSSLFALTLKTGSDSPYFPVSAPMVANKSGDRSSSYVTKVSKAVGYTDGTYELQITSADWVGGTVYPVTFTYLIKSGDKIEFKKCTSIYSNFDIVKFVVKSVSENIVELEEDSGNFTEITTTEDSL